MADEIEDQNVIRIWHSIDGWYAGIGPLGHQQFHVGPADSVHVALKILAHMIEHGYWIVDETWIPS